MIFVSNTIHKANNPKNWRTFCGLRKPNRANESTVPLDVDYPATDNMDDVTCEGCWKQFRWEGKLLYQAETLIGCRGIY